MKYKRRVYKMLQMDEKVLKSVNSKANHKKFVDHVVHNNVDKVNKLCSKGLDPNFHCTDNDGGELNLNTSRQVNLETLIKRLYLEVAKSSGRYL